MRRPGRGSVVLALGLAIASTSAWGDPPPQPQPPPQHEPQPQHQPEQTQTPTPAPEAATSLALTIDTAGAEVLVDGTVVGTAPLPADLPVAPGPHHIEVRAAERTPWTRDVVLTPGQRLEIGVALLPAARPSPPPMPPPEEIIPPPPPPPPSTPLGRGPIFWSGVAATGALVLVGTITGSVALSQQGEYEDAGTSRARRRDLYDSMNGLATATDVLLDSALLFGMATAALFLCFGPEETTQRTAGPFEWIGAHCF